MHRVLYVASAALLVAHEIDSAFWREWEVLGLPGGEAGFLAMHVPLVALVLWGYGRLVEGRRAGAVLSLLLALAGLGAAALHGTLLARGGPEFRSPASIALLVAILGVALAQAPFALAALRRRAPGLRIGP